MVDLTIDQIMENLRKAQAEIETQKKRNEEIEAENARLKEVESNLNQQLKNKPSTSRIEPGTPFSDIIRNLNFSDFSTSKPPVNKVIDLDGDGGADPDPNNDKDSGAALVMAMLKEIQKLNDKVEKIPGVPQPLEEATPDSFADSPFEDRIARAEMPKKFFPPTMKPYDGTTDPVEHVSLYKHKVEASSIPTDKKEICMCKGFGSTLTGAALTWYINIPNRSVKSFADLVNLFNRQFASSRMLEKRASDLYRIVQGSNESLRSYLTRFNKEKISIPDCDRGTAVEAYRQGLAVKSGLWEQLTMYGCYSFDDAQAKTLAYIRLEEDPYYKTEITQRSSTDYDKTNRKAPVNRPGQNRPAPYSRTGKNEVNEIQGYLEDSCPAPPIHEYNFCVNLPRLVSRLEQMGQAVRWPRKNDRPNNNRRDTTKWCDFHNDIGHTTEDCHALRKEVAYLLKKGYLQDLITKSGTKTGLESDKTGQKKPNDAPEIMKEVFFINGGSDVCGLTFSAAKRNRDNKTKPPVRRLQQPCSITFDESDLTDIPDGHHDSLVIRMQIGIARVRRILVDGGSSVNIIMQSVLEDMGISEFTKKSNVLVGFSGETRNTLGEIMLPTYIEGVKSYEKFCIIDCLSSYNVILGRPWIHNVKAVPSTYHQCVKIPSEWGVITIKGEQETAQKCYETALKPGNTNT